MSYIVDLDLGKYFGDIIDLINKTKIALYSLKLSRENCQNLAWYETELCYLENMLSSLKNFERHLTFQFFIGEVGFVEWNDIDMDAIEVAIGYNVGHSDFD